MARIFISYSHRNMQFKDQFVNWFKANHPDHIIRDDTHLKGGQDWWPKVLQEVATCDVFVYLVSNKSLKSNYCRQEFAQAVNQGKRILPILIHGNIDWNLAGEIAPLLRRIQWVDLSKGMGNVPAMLLLDRSLTYLLAGGEKPKEASGTFDVRDVNAGFANVGGKVIVKDDLIVNYTTPPDNDPEWYRDPAILVQIALGLLAAVVAVFVGVLTVSPERFPFTVQFQETRTAVALVGTRNGASNNGASNNGASNLVTDTPITTDTPLGVPTTDPLQIAGMTQTREAQDFAATLDTLNQTQAAQAIQTATAYAPTEIALQQATVNAILTATRAYYLAQTPSATPIPPTLTPTNTPIPPTNTPVPPTATPDPLAIARTPVTRNADWTPVVQDFDGVAMVLVPAGCFTIGSNDGDSDERNGNEICFSDPFWLDQTEVTQADFRRFGGVAENDSYFQGEDRPVEQITWFEARDYCERRNMRLPTEAEWEYAARGPDEFIYPWGNEFVADNVVYSGNSNSQTANVGSRPAGASWVGAHDLSGNVWEWTATLYQNYPYSETDGRNNNDNRTDVRGLRGGSWLINARSVRSANRNGNNPTNTDSLNGFRCVRPLL